MPTFEHNWYPKEHQGALIRAARRIRNDIGAVVEVGSFEGQSAWVLAKEFEHLLCVDPWGRMDCGADRPDEGAMRVYEKFCEMTWLTSVPIVRFRCGWEQFFEIFDGPLRFLHIDAVHEYSHVKGNIEAALPYAVPGAIFCGHDYCNLWPGVKEAVDEMFPQRIVDEWVWSVQL